MRSLLAAFVVAGLVASGAAACSRSDETRVGAEAPVAAGPVGASRQTAAEADATLATLRRLPGTDDVYAMTYSGDYDDLAGVPTPPSPSPFGCSLFYATGDAARPVYGRNFDWDPNPALVLHTDPPDGHASVSIVDISYLGLPRGVDPLADAAARRNLLDAPLLPFDGMNAEGLVVGLAADDSARAEAVPGRPTVGSVRILRLMLDRASTVDEALAVLDRYNLDFDGGPPLHYLLADASGASAVVEFVDGHKVVTRGATALTNFRVAGADAGDVDRRYATIQAALAATGGVLDWRRSMDVLRSVVQSHTRWSVTYEPRGGAVHLVARQRWETVHEFSVR
ncbi:carcinine hydrolase/isopenicillin-N N-acyltransferase family protein [Virgisporangium ochraceum]|uniref:carcinine hydrolase/isopenicillin-N N-acyltransferase family protein n=1 Tax=Virgisporangium ochraceum TaxID=65505 RepID=UPI0019415BFC|nr:carcinine hydrolase/isopenicillin-N N-acyltransferase family protein [Virgisporangium ochraceum]